MNVIDLLIAFCGVAVGMYIAWKRLKPKVDWEINELI